jgi:DNA-binding transcriptional LysR family regulator
MFDWDDLKFFLAGAEHGSTSAAGRALSIDQFTIQRRLLQLEKRIGQALVERRQAGYRLTAYGQAVLPHALAVQKQMSSLERFVKSSARELAGVIRLTCPEPIVARITKSPLLDHLAAKYPALHVEFVMSDRYIDLSKGEADVALRSGDTIDNELVGRKIADSLWAVYGGRDYLAEHGTPSSTADYTQHQWISFDGSMSAHRATQWLAETVPGAHIVASSGSVLGMVHAVKANVGLAPLPTALGDAEPDIVRVLGPVPELKWQWRMVTTRQLRQTPRVSAFFAFMVSKIPTLKPILTG